MEFGKYLILKANKNYILKQYTLCNEMLASIVIYIWKAENELARHSSREDSKINLEQIESSK